MGQTRQDYPVRPYVAIAQMPKITSVSPASRIGYGAVAVAVTGTMVLGVRTMPQASARPLFPPYATQIDLPAGATVASVTTSGTAIWALVKHAPGQARVSAVRIDARTDNVVSWTALPGPATQVAFGRAWLWAFGGAANRVSAVDTVGGAAASLRLARGAAITSIAALGPTAYAAIPSRNQILMLTVRGNKLHARAIHEAGHPTSVVALRGVLQPSSADRNLEPIYLAPHSRAFAVDVLSERVPVIAPAGSMGVWGRTGRAVEREVVGARGNLLALRIRPAHRPVAVVSARDGSCYVAIRNFDRPGRANLFYYRASSIAGGSPLPSQGHDGRQITSLALHPLGGVVYVDNHGQLWRWVPAGVPLR